MLLVADVNMLLLSDGMCTVAEFYDRMRKVQLERRAEAKREVSSENNYLAYAFVSRAPSKSSKSHASLSKIILSR